MKENNSQEFKPIKGILISSGCLGLYDNKRNDISLISLETDATVCGYFTQNIYRSATVVISEKNIKENPPKYIIVNAGNANACTGYEGELDIKKYCEKISELTNIKENLICPLSTGVIGERINVERFIKIIPLLLDSLSINNYKKFSKSIMTTDTYNKLCSSSFHCKNGEEIIINGVAKGSGMIFPKMATTLGFFFTNLRISKKSLDKICTQYLEESFNSITVDGETSTNDSLLVISSNTSNIEYEKLNKEDKIKFENTLRNSMIYLAKEVVRDGEGASKFITINVQGLRNTQDAKKAALCIANSNLVKTALFAEDPNWGRVVSALGNSNISYIDCKDLNLKINNLAVFENNSISDQYDEEAVKRSMKDKNIEISLIFSHGKSNATVWTSDLTYNYVKINAEYRS